MLICLSFVRYVYRTWAPVTGVETIVSRLRGDHSAHSFPQTCVRELQPRTRAVPPHHSPRLKRLLQAALANSISKSREKEQG